MIWFAKATEFDRRNRPNGLKVAAIVTGLFVYRLSSLRFIPNVGDADTPEAWLIPYVGDSIQGLLALVVAYLLLRYRGVVVWAVAIAYHVSGIRDYMNGFMMERLDPVLNGPGPEWLLEAWLSVWAIIEIAVLVVLARTVVAHYFTSDRASTSGDVAGAAASMP